MGCLTLSVRNVGIGAPRSVAGREERS